ncbi:DUF4349 domain-containing protein [Cloacibacterium sp. TD35]|uniref:DUF4349 domain-containing protein n=1 Tax=Cloacibacterium sp. TD35 TaxID=2976818 RepID=UPI00237DCAF7|nr:DUF4349 domain-containing protein [Cloacibacterium sp. TD35]WDT67451.1 DUF4349 domain-containing protein [Cloacibacterium sp. TD35]
MKKTIFSLFTATLFLVACNKTDIQQTADSFKTADSLFNQAKESYQTIDTISKIVNDSNSTVGKVIAPELNKHKKIIEEAIKNGNVNIDSINKVFKKLNHKNIQAQDIRKAIDSANNAIKSGDNAAAVIAETADKILKQTSQNNTQNQPEPEVQNQNQVQKQPIPQRELYPIAKTIRLQVSVEDLAAAKAILNQDLSVYKADVITENYTENEGIAKQYVTVKVPLSNFDELVNKMSNLGNVESKNTEVEGKDYVGSQMCDVELTLVDNTPDLNKTSEDLNILNDEQKDETFVDKSSNAFMKGFAVLGSLFLALVPFWPIFLIAGIVWYFVAKRNKKKREEEFQRQLAIEKEKIKAAEALKTPSEEISQNSPTNTEENKKDDDISKYMPKE